MPKCTKIYRKKRQISIGDLDTLIILHTRDIQSPVFNAIDFSEDFTPDGQVWAKVSTVAGKTYFDGVSTDVNISHEICIRFDVNVTSETWVEFDGRRIDILDVEDLDERHEFMKLICTDRGLKVNSGADA